MRRIIVLAALAASTAFAASRVKFIDFRSIPRTVPGLRTLLGKEKNQDTRTAAALTLSNVMRQSGKPILAPETDVAVTVVLDAVFDQMAAPTDIYTWEKDNFGARGDILCREKALLYPGVVSAGWEKKFTRLLKGKRIDRGYLNSDCTLTVTAAKTPEEFWAWVDTKGWGILPHTVLATDNVARVGLTLFSKGSTGIAPRAEKPVYVGFVHREKESADWTLLSAEPVTQLDVRKQESNIFADNQKPTDDERKERLAQWMELVKALPPRASLTSLDQQYFLLQGTGADNITNKEKALLEPYRKHESALVRAAAELKLSRLGVATTPEALAALAVSLDSHPAEQNEVLRELYGLVGTNFEKSGAPCAPEEVSALHGVAVPKEKAEINRPDQCRVWESWAKLTLFNSNAKGVLFKKEESGWKMLGAYR